MTRRLDQLAALRPVPGAVSIRPLDLDRDAVALHEVNEASFAANADYEPESLPEFCEEHLRAPDLDPELSGVAEHGDGLIGFLLVRRRSDNTVGFVDLLAVHPGRQRRGVGAALLQTAFARLAATGLRSAELGVASDNPRALRLYERVGMTTAFRVDTYERPIDDA